MADYAHLMDLLKSFQDQGLGPEKFVPEGTPINVVEEFNPIASGGGGPGAGHPEVPIESSMVQPLDLLNIAGAGASIARNLSGRATLAVPNMLAKMRADRLARASGGVPRPDWAQTPQQIAEFGDNYMAELAAKEAASIANPLAANASKAAASKSAGTYVGGKPAVSAVENWVEAETPESLAVTKKWLPLIEDAFYR